MSALVEVTGLCIAVDGGGREVVHGVDFEIPAGGTVGFVGESIGLPDWVTGFSPYQHVPKMPALPFEAAPELILLAIAVALAGAGWAVFRRRDIG